MKALETSKVEFAKNYIKNYYEKIEILDALASILNPYGVVQVGGSFALYLQELENAKLKNRLQSEIRPSEGLDVIFYAGRGHEDTIFVSNKLEEFAGEFGESSRRAFCSGADFSISMRLYSCKLDIAVEKISDYKNDGYLIKDKLWSLYPSLTICLYKLKYAMKSNSAQTSLKHIKDLKVFYPEMYNIFNLSNQEVHISQLLRLKNNNTNKDDLPF